MLDKSFAVPKTTNRTDLPVDAVLLGSKNIYTAPLRPSDVEFNDLPQADIIIQCFTANMMLDKLTEFTYLVVEYDMDLDAYEVQWYMTFPTNEMKVHLALIETKNEILGGLY